METILTAADMRMAEARAFDSGLVRGGALMERAGAAVVAAVLAAWPDLARASQQAPPQAIVLCGPGNNGGDGLVIARLLRDRGWSVTAVLAGDPDRLPPDARANLARWRAIGPVQTPPLMPLAPPSARHGVIVDALFGIGLRRGLDPALRRDLLAPLDRPPFAGWHRVAVDVPSGLCADSGRVLTGADGTGAALRADLTVTFHRLKPGHLLADGPALCGKVVCADIGLPPTDAPLRRIGPPDAARIAKPSGHKYDHGHALVLAGPPGQGGAARMAARGALRIGAGLVTLGCAPAAMAENAARLDAIMLRPVPEAGALTRMLGDGRITALCLGPALGTGLRARRLIAAALCARRATLLDADALTLLARHPALFGALHPACVLTPHGGEFARLFPDIAANLAAPASTGPGYSKLDATRAAAARAGCVVLFKGPDTVIATPQGHAAIHAAADDRATPWLATAGAGDVLAGIIAGLMARGKAPFDAACIGAWLHVEAARHFGPGLIAEDLPDALPAVLRQLGIT